MLDKDHFTTGQIAEMCHVSAPTVGKWIKDGDLKGFQLPRSNAYRVKREDLIEFMQKYDIPLGGLNLDESEKKRVLIVDDDREIRQFLESVFQEEGSETKTVICGFDARVAEEFKPDCVLLDIMLPDIDGRKVCNYLRGNPKLKDMKIIAISGYIRSNNEFKNLIKYGFDDLMAKPFDNDALLEKVNDLIEV